MLVLTLFHNLKWLLYGIIQSKKLHERKHEHEKKIVIEFYIFIQ